MGVNASSPMAAADGDQQPDGNQLPAPEPEVHPRAHNNHPGHPPCNCALLEQREGLWKAWSGAVWLAWGRCSLRGARMR